jgi:hypothetical protein
LRAGAAFAFAARFTLPPRAELAVFFLAALAFGAFAAFACRLRPLLAAAARPAAARFLEGVRFCPFVLPLFLAIAVLCSAERRARSVDEFL